MNFSSECAHGQDIKYSDRLQSLGWRVIGVSSDSLKLPCAETSSDLPEAMEIQTTCPTAEEAALLHAALNDFSRDGARSAYADWLASAGEDARAATVRQTIEAYHSFDAAALENVAGTPAWQMMLGVPFLQAFAESELKADRTAFELFRDQFFGLIRPAVLFAYAEAGEETPAVGSSYLWGQPDMPAGSEWPLVAEATNWFSAKDKLPADYPMLFVGQFNYAEFGGTVFGQSLPKRGGFSVFSICEAMEFGIVEIVLRSWPDASVLVRREAPKLAEDTLGDSSNLPQPCHRIVAREILSLPDADGPMGQTVAGSWSSDQKIFYEDLWFICEDVRNAFQQSLDFEMDETVSLGLGGYLTATSGEDPSPNADSLRFAVLRTNPDCNIAHFAIPQADFPSGNLERVAYVWNDWDS